MVPPIMSPSTAMTQGEPSPRGLWLQRPGTGWRQGRVQDRVGKRCCPLQGLALCGRPASADEALRRADPRTRFPAPPGRRAVLGRQAGDQQLLQWLHQQCLFAAVSLQRGSRGPAATPRPGPDAERTAPLRVVEPQRVLDLQQYPKSVNVTSGCVPAPRAQTLGRAPQGQRAAALRQVGSWERSLRQSWGRSEDGPPHSCDPSDPPTPGSPTQPPPPPGPWLHATPAPEDHPGRLPVWGSPVQSPGVCPRPGPPWELVSRGQAGWVWRGRTG